MSETTTTTTTTDTIDADPSDTGAVVDRYLMAYGETDAQRRRALIEQSFDPGATLADPPFEATGHAALDATFDAVQAQFPRHRFRRTSAVDQHHAVARYEWELVGPDGSVAVAGTDFVHFAGDGRLDLVAGFFGPVPAPAA